MIAKVARAMNPNWGAFHRARIKSIHASPLAMAVRKTTGIMCAK
jgi:hypothetical protein